MSEKADTYSFGVVLLEIISGRRCGDTNIERDTDFLLEYVSYGIYSIQSLVHLLFSTIFFFCQFQMMNTMKKLNSMTDIYTHRFSDPTTAL